MVSFAPEWGAVRLGLSNTSNSLMRSIRLALWLPVAICAAIMQTAYAQFDRADAWRMEWALTDFTQRSVSLDEIDSVIPKDAIQSIDKPRFISVGEVALENDHARRNKKRKRRSGKFSLSEQDPVISVEINGDARAYPLRVMIYHEIVNDVFGGEPVVVTYCPLCNTGVVFDGVLNGKPIEFGVSGKLRKSDLIMYDRQTESWWQQYSGEAIVGAMTGQKLNRRITRMESFASFKRRHADGVVLIPNNPRDARYGRNPYIRYDSERRPFLYRGGLPDGIAPLARVVVVGNVAYSLARLSRTGIIEEDGVRLTWQAGQASALDAERISDGRDVGDVVVQRLAANGEWEDIAYDVIFAFAFHAFHPKGDWRL